MNTAKGLFVDTRVAPSKDELLHALNADNMPPPGTTSSILGFGDSIGGRPTFVYIPSGYYPPEIVLNSVSDVPQTGDERAFVTARAVDSATVPDFKQQYDFYVDGRDRDVFQVRYVLSNNAQQQADCSVLEGDLVAKEVRVRVTIDSSDDGRQVIRMWATWGHAVGGQQQWITDATVIDLDEGKTLLLDPAGSSEFRLTPAYKETMPNAGAAFSSGGMAVADGLLGGCYDNRVYGIFQFTVGDSTS